MNNTAIYRLRKAVAESSFCAFIHKEFLHIFRDVRTMLILLVMPVVLILLFGYAVTTEVRDTRVGVAGCSGDAVTSLITERFAANRYFNIVALYASEREVEAAFGRGEIDMAMLFSDGFASELGRGTASVQLLIDGTEPNQAGARAGYAQQILMQCQQELAQKPLQGMPSVAPSSVMYTVGCATRMLYNPQLKSEYNFVPGVIGMIILLICAMMTSIAIVREKENGTMEILLASPLPPFYIVLAKLIPYFIISSVNLTTILLLSKYLLCLPVTGSLWAFFGVSMLYIVVSLSLGLLISSCVGTQLAAMLLSLLLIVPTLYLSGLVFMVDSMPVVLQYISGIVPARWYVDALRKIMIQGAEVQYIAKDCAILGLMAMVLIGVSIKLFKTRLS